MSYDILIKNGKLVDGTGNPWVRANLAITNGKIVKIGRLANISATKEIDATDQIVCPGFIDPHDHSDYSIPFNPHVPSTTRQGITTLIIGQCGFTLAPVNPEREDLLKKLLYSVMPPGAELDITWNTFAEFLQTLEQWKCAANVAPLVGFGTIRIAGGPGYSDRAPTPDEYKQMKAYVKEAMEAGAFGFSTGLIYTPQAFAKTAEVIELAKVAGEYNGLYFSHIRGEGGTVIEAVKEVIEIVEKSGCIGGQVGHHKVAGKAYWGASKETMCLLEEANSRGLAVACDQYPYKRGLSSLITVLPPWVHIGGTEKIVERLQNSDDQARIKENVMEGIEGWENWIRDVGFDRIYISAVKLEKNKKLEGMSITEATQTLSKADEWETIFDLLVEEKAEVQAFFESMGDEDINRIMTGRYTMIGTDGWAASPTGILSLGKPHPRFYGTYPRVLGKYVREDNLLTLEEAIRKMTSFPAQQMRLWDRGLLREGMWADIVIFDPKTVRDTATYVNPHQFPIGINYVLVNGELVVEEDQQTERLPGKVIRRPT